jgi:hypothetical protein
MPCYNGAQGLQLLCSANRAAASVKFGLLLMVMVMRSCYIKQGIGHVVVLRAVQRNSRWRWQHVCSHVDK